MDFCNSNQLQDLYECNLVPYGIKMTQHRYSDLTANQLYAEYILVQNVDGWGLLTKFISTQYHKVEDQFINVN